MSNNPDPTPPPKHPEHRTGTAGTALGAAAKIATR